VILMIPFCDRVAANALTSPMVNLHTIMRSNTAPHTTTPALLCNISLMPHCRDVMGPSLTPTDLLREVFDARVFWQAAD
jgi:hypothetical protein